MILVVSQGAVVHGYASSSCYEQEIQGASGLKVKLL